MYPLLSTFNDAKALMPVKKMDQLISKLLFWILIADMVIIPAVLVKLYIYPRPTIIALAKERDDVGMATESLIKKLSTNGFSPVIFGAVHRASFTVDGKLIILGDDNIQVFEYIDRATALNEASALMRKYTASSRSKEWKENMHIYINDTLVIFYMGNKKLVTDTLEQNVGLSLIQSKSP